jgi:hypothetical protein
VDRVTQDRIIGSVSIRSDDCEKRRICDMVVDDQGHIYIIDVESDQKRGKKKYIACIDSYIELMKKKVPKVVKY